MPENDEGLEQPQNDDAALEAEFRKLEEEMAGAQYDEDGNPVEPDAQPDDPEEESEKPDASKPKELTPEEQEAEDIEIARRFLLSRGHRVALPGEDEAEKEGARAEAKQQTAEDVLSSLPDVQLDPNVIALIDEKYGHDPVMRDAMFTRYATKVAVEQVAEAKAAEKLAPFQQQQESAMWDAKARATAQNIAAEANTPEAAEALYQIILDAGPQSERLYATDKNFRAGMEARLKLAVLEVQNSIADTGARPLQKAERTGGGRSPVAPMEDGLKGEAAKIAEGVRKDVAAGRMSKKDGDALIKSLRS